MTKQEKNEVIEVLKGKFTQYSNFYVTDTESLTVAQITKLRSHCFDKQVEMKVAKNTLIKKALEGLDSAKYAGVYDSLHNVTALLFSENPKEPALIISGFRKESKGEKPELKAAFINGDIFVGDNQLKVLTQIKTKNELIGEVIGLLMSPIQRVMGALQNKDAKANEETIAETAPPVPEVTAQTAEVAAPVAEASVPAADVAPVAEAIAPTAKAIVPTVQAAPVTEANAPTAIADDIATTETKAPAAE